MSCDMMRPSNPLSYHNRYFPAESNALRYDGNNVTITPL